jgi:GAF domain-containing protein
MLLQAFADQAAIAVNNARLFRQVSRKTNDTDGDDQNPPMVISPG